MELRCPQCKSGLVVSDDELFPSCACGFVFESIPILDKPVIKNEPPAMSKPLSSIGSSSVLLSVEPDDVAALFEETLVDEKSGTKPDPQSSIKPTSIKKEGRSKMTTPTSLDEVLLCTSSLDPSYQVGKYFGIVVAEVLLDEGSVVEELAKDLTHGNKPRYNEAITKLTKSLQNRAFQLGANAVTNVNFQHQVLPTGLGGPGLMIFAQGTAIKFN